MTDIPVGHRPLIAVVGVCASGKSTLVDALRAKGLNARQVLQEHSYVPDMWLRITKPDLLIFLDASLDAVRSRRRDPEWPDWLFTAERHRLRDARARCDLYLHTESLTTDEVISRALAWLRLSGVPLPGA